MIHKFAVTDHYGYTVVSSLDLSIESRMKQEISSYSTRMQAYLNAIGRFGNSPGNPAATRYGESAVPGLGKDRTQDTRPLTLLLLVLVAEGHGTKGWRVWCGSEALRLVWHLILHVYYSWLHIFFSSVLPLALCIRLNHSLAFCFPFTITFSLPVF